MPSLRSKARPTPRGWSTAVSSRVAVPAGPTTWERSSSYCVVYCVTSSFAASTIIGVFFLLPQIGAQPSQDTARMHLDAAALHQKCRQLLAFEHPSRLLYSLGQDSHGFVVELVGPLRPALARQQSRQALALE